MVEDIPDGIGDLPQGDVADLVDTLTGLCNESELTRAEILGALEATKLRLWWTWQREHEQLGQGGG